MKHSPPAAKSETSAGILLAIGVALLVSACTTVTRVSPRTVQYQFASANLVQIKPINLNTASAEELKTLPGIGEGIAARIITHRETYGAFRRPEHLLMVRGISDRKFRALRARIVVE